MEPLGTEPAGIFVHKDFISEEHEDAILRIFRNQLDWPDRKGRRSLHYGYTFSYKTFAIDQDVPYEPFPDWLTPLLPTSEGRPPDQVCVQHYPPGAGIPPHVDTHSAFDQLYSLSLGSPVLMQFCHGGTKQKTDVDLAPRTMMQMSGASRLHWTHGIRARKTDRLDGGDDETVRPRRDRWSITYRWLRDGAVCECGDERLCDTAQRRMGVEREYRWKEAEANRTGRQDT
ncbi:uncharacterized protein LMH87_008096 [Akanthomyces muscarius]|uniref:Oxoglutarate/iron-dependent oxygenase n=2 Tax=Akanthomyces TaxID=150366 RepID=A0A168D018_CORDF|nr:uncharacterized protein LMH87_008096 [Akanthomyces muscarius]KAJ4159188.1 hypothetical protein LMH87_008096 [Akanthomyces muscarius]OAA72005.1 Oxoglutarate/iron-dependent oxygenase [Akanthomyces lecanii RCEF 1005]